MTPRTPNFTSPGSNVNVHLNMSHVGNRAVMPGAKLQTTPMEASRLLLIVALRLRYASNVQSMVLVKAGLSSPAFLLAPTVTSIVNEKSTPTVTSTPNQEITF